jgi:hypothetical protein
VWRRARDYLGLMHEPAICSSVLGPSTGYLNRPGSVQWSQGGNKAVASIPFYLLGGNEGTNYRIPHSEFTVMFMFRVLNSINAEQEVLAEGHDHTLLSTLLLKVWLVLRVQRVSKAMIFWCGLCCFCRCSIS